MKSIRTDLKAAGYTRRHVVYIGLSEKGISVDCSVLNKTYSFEMNFPLQDTVWLNYYFAKILFSRKHAVSIEFPLAKNGTPIVYVADDVFKTKELYVPVSK